MSSGDQSFGSNNPFRRKPSTPTSTPSPTNPAEPPTSSSGLEGHPVPSAPTTQPPLTTFKSALSESERRYEEEQPIRQRPKKIVKKVRVQSPPPSSPEDAVPVTRFPALKALDQNGEDNDDDDDDDSTSDTSDSEEQSDPFNPNSVLGDENPSSESPLPQIPPNPFARTLQDIEGGGQMHDGAAKNTSKGSLDVDSFKRLLLTGYANLPQPGQAGTKPPGNATPHYPGPTLPDGSSNTDASSTSRQSILDALQETPRTSHEISESEAPTERKTVFSSSPLANVSSTTGRKKPPPPSSRHGKLIKIDLGAGPNSHGSALAGPATTGPPSAFIASPNAGSESTVPMSSPPASTDVNKPLPAPPLRAFADEEAESPFDREAAGKVPEAFAQLQANPRPPTPPPTTRTRSESQNSTQSRRPAVPPPRRHGRSDSRVPSIHSLNADEDPPRSSLESSRSRTDSLRLSMNPERTYQAPAPPPPRRPSHARAASSFAINSQPSLSPAISPSVGEKERNPLASGSTPTPSPSAPAKLLNGLGTTALGGGSKSSPPPPPPARNKSMRRPASVRGVEGSNGLGSVRKVSREKEPGAPPPPPPPPRARGSARPNPNLAPTSEETTRRGSVDTISGSAVSTPIPGADGETQGTDILADLDALQREVDELMRRSTRG